jgi:hypothetical protein
MMNHRLLITLLFLIIVGGETAMAIEKPDYQVLKKYDQFEIRGYASYLIAETEIDSDFEEASNIAFRILFDYISGNNEQQEKIKMTAPVNQKTSESEGEKISMTAPVSQKTGDNGKFAISFVVPSKYTMKTVPRPKDPRVKIRKIPEKTMAAIKYSGNWSEQKYRAKENLLIEELHRRNINIIGDPVFARYNPPFWPAFLRRNEILIEIELNPDNLLD